MRVKFWVGDWSHDGHNQCDSFVVDVNLTKPELDKAFHDGCKLMGLEKAQCKALNFLFCSEYEDVKIPQEIIDGMDKVGLSPDKYFDMFYKDESKWSGNYDTFHILWLDIAKLGNPDLTYQECVSEETYHIGGYGLYFC